MAKTYFITGTDTDVGKTEVACGLLQALAVAGMTTVGLKPVAAGCEHTDEGLRNSDALKLLAAATEQLAYDQVNPIALEPAIAPHIAAAKINRPLSIDRLAGFCRGVQMMAVDKVIIEGAGGWRVPVNARETLADLPKVLNIPVIMVVGLRLGCLNHALLTAEAIARDGLVLAGWVVNILDPDMPEQSANIATLQAMIQAPCLGVVPYMQGPEAGQIATFIDVKPL